MKKIEAVPFVTVPVGWMKCIACSDFKQYPGRMWLGYNRFGGDISIACPACGGTGLVERVKHIDVRTGQEIDYEKPGQRFVAVDAPTQAKPASADRPLGDDAPLIQIASR
jgi:hypothetical protein